MESGKVVVQQEGTRLADEAPEAIEAGAGAGAESAGSKEGRAGLSGIEALKPGMKLKGRVRKIVDFGAFVDIGVGRDGLVHVSALRRAEIDKKIKVGQVLDVLVRRVNVENGRITLTIPNARRQPKTSLEALAVASVVSGRVVRLVDFGAFVDIGARTDGLLHISQLSSGHVNHTSEVLQVGDKVRVRILEVDSRKRRISLSMKDLDGGRQPARAFQAVENHGHIPTAFEVAFEEARAVQRRQRRPHR